MIRKVYTNFDLLYINQETVSTANMKKIYENLQKKVFLGEKILYNDLYLFLKGGRTMTIRIGILGYGNLGKGVEYALRSNADMELVGVFTRRDPASVKTVCGASLR